MVAWTRVVAAGDGEVDGLGGYGGHKIKCGGAVAGVIGKAARAGAVLRESLAVQSRTC